MDETTVSNTAANTGSFTVTMDFDVAHEDDGTLENIGDAIQDGFDDFLGFLAAMTMTTTTTTTTGIRRRAPSTCGAKTSRK